MPPLATEILGLLAKAGLTTLLFLGSALLPILVLCVALLLLGRFLNRRLLDTFGWQAVLLAAWIGTPVHEFSHLVACWIGRNKVEDFALFKPDAKSGSLGYVQHSYDSQSFYQRVIGNTLVGLAPFLGGSLVIYLLTKGFFPDLLIDHPATLSLTADKLGDLTKLAELGRAWWTELGVFYRVLFDTNNLSRWQFWLYLFAMISLAAHLSPSRADFEGLGRPLLLLLVLLYLTELTLVSLAHFKVVTWALPLVNPVVLVGLLVLALLFLILGALFVGLITAIWQRLVPGQGRASARD